MKQLNYYTHQIGAIRAQRRAREAPGRARRASGRARRAPGRAKRPSWNTEEKTRTTTKTFQKKLYSLPARTIFKLGTITK